MNNTSLGTICLIDDDKIYQLLTTKIIEKVNPEQKVITFYNGKQAIDYFLSAASKGSLPDVIFLDINMPIMNGWDFLEVYSRLEEINDIPVIMVSSSLDEDDAIRSRQYSVVQDFITKPMGQQLISEILSMLNRGKLPKPMKKNAQFIN